MIRTSTHYPPEGERSGGGAGLGLGGVKEKLAEETRRKESDIEATGFRKLPRRFFIVIKLHKTGHLSVGRLVR